MQSWPPPPSSEQEEAGRVPVGPRVRLHLHFRSPCLSVLQWLLIDLNFVESDKKIIHGEISVARKMISSKYLDYFYA